MENWRANLVEDQGEIAAIARAAKRIAVLGMKTEAQDGQPALYVPAYLIDAGIDVVPVPVYYPDVTNILGRPVVRRLRDVSPPADMINVFRRSEDIPQHLDDMLAAEPKVVWLQLGIRNDEVATELAKAGIKVVQDRCLLVEHRRAIAGR